MATRKKIIVEGANAQLTTIELGHDTDTTLSRPAAGRMQIEGKEVLTEDNTVTVSNKNVVVGINAQADNYTLVLADAGKLVKVTHANAKTLTVPLHAKVGFPTGTKIAVMQGGAGTITVEGEEDGDEVTILSQGDAFDLAGENAGAVLIKLDDDEWMLEGNIQS